MLHQAGVEITSQTQSVPNGKSNKQSIQIIPPLCTFGSAGGIMGLGMLVTADHVNGTVFELHLDMHQPSRGNNPPTQILCRAKTCGNDAHDTSSSLIGLAGMDMEPTAVTPFTLKGHSGFTNDRNVNVVVFHPNFYLIQLGGSQASCIPVQQA